MRMSVLIVCVCGIVAVRDRNKALYSAGIDPGGFGWEGGGNELRGGAPA